VTQTVTPSEKPSLHSQGRELFGDRLFRYLCLGAGVAVLAVLALILFSTIQQSLPAFSASGIKFFTDSHWIANDPDGDGPLQPRFGALAFIYGSLIVATVALVIAVPVAIGISLFLTQVAPKRLRGPAVMVMDLLAAVPSVVFGLWGVLVACPALVGVYTGLHHAVKDIPVLKSIFGPPVSSGHALMTAGLIVAIMIIPIITSLAREVFMTVPDADKQAAYALGATRWEMIKGAVLPHSFGGLVGAVMLGLGRALGETIAVALVIGSTAQITANLFASGDALPAVIANQWGESSGTHRAALVGLGVVLFVITVLINLTARYIVRRAELRMRGAS